MNKSKDLEMQTPLQSKSQKQPNQEKTQNKQDDYDGYDIRQSSQPLICLLHLLFKFCALFSYLFLGIFLSKAIFRYILIILFQALDFYIVKNITGRFLVGLKWYSDVGANGQVIWKFEYFDLKSRSKVDSSIFWTFQLGFSALWLWFTFYNLITFGIIDVNLHTYQ
ncbi:hypothetical protein pb186bvf_013944 [Paramecium bursaria]